MTRTHIDKEKAAPLWAVIGAPLVGVPLMVGLLALAAPRIAEPVGGPGSRTEATVEWVDSGEASAEAEDGAEAEPLVLRN